MSDPVMDIVLEEIRELKNRIDRLSDSWDDKLQRETGECEKRWIQRTEGLDKRIRANEKKIWIMLGGSAGAGGLAGFLSKFLGG